MLRTFLRAKLHRATITAADPDYEGSVSIDRALCRAAGLLEFEEICVYDISNGVRFTTYVIYGEPGQVQINGAAAQLVKVGDLVILAAYATLAPEEIPAHRVTVLQIGAGNAITSTRTAAIAAA